MLERARERTGASVASMQLVFATVLADLTNAGASKPEPEQAPKAEDNRRALTTAVLQQ